MSSRNSYSREFKHNAVRLVTEDGKSAASVSRDLGISYNMLLSWKRNFERDPKDAFPGYGRLKTKDEYIRQLERENKRLKDERDILKKATAFFANEP